MPYSYVVSRHFAYVRHHFWWASEISLGKKQGFVLWRTLCIDAKLGKIRVLSLLKFQCLSHFYYVVFSHNYFLSWRKLIMDVMIISNFYILRTKISNLSIWHRQLIFRIKFESKFRSHYTSNSFILPTRTKIES